MIGTPESNMHSGRAKLKLLMAANAARATFAALVLSTAISSPSRPRVCVWYRTIDDVAIHDVKNGKRLTSSTYTQKAMTAKTKRAKNTMPDVSWLEVHLIHNPGV